MLPQVVLSLHDKVSGQTLLLAEVLHSAGRRATVSGLSVLLGRVKVKVAPAELQSDAAEAGDVLTWNGSVWTPATPTGGVSDHGALTGLEDDDHLQYLTNTRGDARYLRSSGGWSATIPVGAGKSLTVVNDQITNATF